LLNQDVPAWPFLSPLVAATSYGKDFVGAPFSVGDVAGDVALDVRLIWLHMEDKAGFGIGYGSH